MSMTLHAYPTQQDLGQDQLADFDGDPTPLSKEKGEEDSQTAA